MLSRKFFRRQQLRRETFSSAVQMYFVSKTLAEQAAWKYAKENNIDFITIIPTLVVGPFIMSSMPPSLITALSPITGTSFFLPEYLKAWVLSLFTLFLCLVTGNEAHYSIIRQGQFVHLDDLCNAHIYLFENPKAEGRYICSSHDCIILDLAKMLREKYPEYNIPTE